MKKIEKKFFRPYWVNGFHFHGSRSSTTTGTFTHKSRYNTVIFKVWFCRDNEIGLAKIRTRLDLIHYVDEI